MRCFQNTSRDCNVIFAGALFIIHSWLGPMAKKKKHNILSAVEMVNFLLFGGAIMLSLIHI